jgi:hypothetical protein
MNSSIVRRTAVSWLLSSLVIAGVPLTALAQQNVSVQINGQPVSFDQPPVERAGRVFVPLRGVFERLGATVVYSNGTINATGNGRTIQLHLGSTQATVNGQSQYLDVAPFLIGARTLVPLRFIAQSLGATVNWNSSNRTVYINGGGNNPAPQNTAPPNASFYLRGKRPTGSVNTESPAIHAVFSEPINRDTMHVLVDGRDVTNNVYANANGFDVTPPTPLSPGNHHVEVTGVTAAGSSFRTGWNFTIGNSSSRNFLRNVSPADGARVNSNFTFTGTTQPGSQVHVVASGATSAFGGLLQLNAGTFQTTVQADNNGVFRAQISLNSVGGAQVRVLVQSIAPDGTSTERSFTYSM